MATNTEGWEWYEFETEYGLGRVFVKIRRRNEDENWTADEQVQ